MGVFSACHQTLGNRWKRGDNFCPQKHVELAGHVLLECQFIEIEMFSGGISISLMFQSKPSSICFETCQPALFLCLACLVLAHPWGTLVTLRPGCLMESWKSGCLSYKVPGCSSVLSGERLFHSGYVRASKSPLARAWESEEVRWDPCLPPESPAGRMRDPGVGGSSVVLLSQCRGTGIFPG